MKWDPFFNNQLGPDIYDYMIDALGNMSNVNTIYIVYKLT